jgi:hypothetical protein
MPLWASRSSNRPHRSTVHIGCGIQVASVFQCMQDGRTAPFVQLSKAGESLDAVPPPSMTNTQRSRWPGLDWSAVNQICMYQFFLTRFTSNVWLGYFFSPTFTFCFASAVFSRSTVLHISALIRTKSSAMGKGRLGAVRNGLALAVVPTPLAFACSSHEGSHIHQGVDTLRSIMIAGPAGRGEFDWAPRAADKVHVCHGRVDQK